MKLARIATVLIAFALAGITLPAQEVRRDTIRASRITAARQHHAGTRMVKSSEIRMLVTPLGDGSAIKLIQTLPGVATGAEGSSAIYVRGGNIGSNVITIDGVPLYGSGHILGFSTSYSPDIVSDTRFLVGGFTSEEGNLTSSHIKVSTRDGDFNKLSGGVSASPFILGGHISTPIVKDKLSFLGAVRFSPVGWELQAVKGMTRAMDGISDITAMVGDAYGKFKWQISPRQSLSLSGFYSLDSYGYTYGSTSRDKMGWSNAIVSLHHEISFDSPWRMETGLSANRFMNYQGMSKTLEGKDNAVDLQSGLEEATLRSTAIWQGGSGWTFQGGLKGRYASFTPGPSARSNTLLLTAHGQIEKSQEGRYEVVAAGRVNYFSSGQGTYKGNNLHSFAPEVSLSGKVFLVRNLLGLEATYDRTVQYYHTLEGIPLGWSLDMLIPSDAQFSPEKASQVYAGFFLSGKKHRITAGAYYKKMDDLIFFKDATRLFSSAAAGWRDEIKTGAGTSKGVELLYELDLEKLDARVAYTLSKTDRDFPEINEGKTFPAKFDRRHILNARLAYVILKDEKTEWGVNTFFTYQSGHWATVPAGQFSGWITPGEQEVTIDYHSCIHNWQAPPYIRWDVGAFLNYGVGSRHPGTLNAGIYNLLNRHNVYSIMYDPDSRSWKSLSLFPVMPTVSWTMEF
jgi:hypothetical protein